MPPARAQSLVGGGDLLKLVWLRPRWATEITPGLWQGGYEAISFTKHVSRVAPERWFPNRLPRSLYGRRIATSQECGRRLAKKLVETLARLGRLFVPASLPRA